MDVSQHHGLLLGMPCWDQCFKSWRDQPGAFNSNNKYNGRNRSHSSNDSNNDNNVVYQP